MEAIERIADLAQEQLDKEAAGNIVIQTVLAIVEDFLRANRLMCYGGTAINNLLPKDERFYDPERDIPDYDFFSMTPQIHAMELADKIAAAGYTAVEVKPGMHLGTFKVFANFTGVADISLLEKPIFERLWKDAVTRDDINYVPPNFLRMSVYLELSRPRGDVSRWKKVYSRIERLNKHYPIVCPAKAAELTHVHVSPELRKAIEAQMVREKVVLLGFNASTLQSHRGSGQWKLPLDVLVTPDKVEETADTFRAMFAGSHVKKGHEYGELLPAYVDVMDGNTTLVRVYETAACHSYHEFPSGLRVASIPTLLQFFLAMMYGDDSVREHLPEQRFLCTAQNLLDMVHDSSARRYQLLTPIDCVGKQDSIVDMKMKKALTYERVAQHGKSSPQYLKQFFTYDPHKLSASKKQELRERLKRMEDSHHSG